MNANDFLKTFDQEAFWAKEFPNSVGRYPDIERSLRHFNKITRLLMECALKSLDKAEEDDSESAIHANTRYTLVCNYRLRTLNLIKVFNDIVDLRGGALFDEGTASIIARSLLEIYLVYFRLYNGCGGDKKTQELYFGLYDLSTILHYLKHAKFLKGYGEVKLDEANVIRQINKLIANIKHSDKYPELPKAIHASVGKVENGQQDYLSFINFNKLIRESPLPTEFITSYYSYSSSFAHSEGFSSSISQIYFQSREKWNELNEMSKFKLLYICLAVSSQFFISYIEYDQTELADDKLQEVFETLSLSNYYLTAVNYNK